MAGSVSAPGARPATTRAAMTRSRSSARSARLRATALRTPTRPPASVERSKMTCPRSPTGSALAAICRTPAPTAAWRTPVAPQRLIRALSARERLIATLTSRRRSPKTTALVRLTQAPIAAKGQLPLRQSSGSRLSATTAPIASRRQPATTSCCRQKTPVVTQRQLRAIAAFSRQPVTPTCRDRKPAASVPAVAQWRIRAAFTMQHHLTTPNPNNRKATASPPLATQRRTLGPIAVKP
ncbi:hypothetical protein A4R44_06880 [Amycolatopsis sp. M39]|nr:hypothetical protein A4R44_06880 [Amycolatopsis sp. M39]